MRNSEQIVVYYDGLCNLCSSTVRFIKKRDRSGKFEFVPLQLEEGEEMFHDLQIPDNVDSVLVLLNNKLFHSSDAILKIAVNLKFPWLLFGAFYIVPRFIRDFIYRIIARNRYRWFGRRNSCYIPD